MRSNFLFIPTIFLFPCLYLLGWLSANTFAAFFPGIKEVFISYIATFITFILFLILLPSWIKYRWKQNKPLSSLGLDNPSKNRNLLQMIKGFIWSFCLITFLCLFLFSGGWINGFSTVSTYTFFNAIFLILIVGFVEELIFRGWLMGELIYLFGYRYGIIFQALIFSILHIRLDFPFVHSFSLLFGLFLLGLILALRRILDEGSLWGCIGLHGGLVGLWFIVETSLLRISVDTPSFLIGFGNGKTNPIGGLISIFIMLLILYYQRKSFLRNGRFFTATVKASSSEEIP